MLLSYWDESMGLNFRTFLLLYLVSFHFDMTNMDFFTFLRCTIHLAEAWMYMLVFDWLCKAWNELDEPL